MIKKFWIARDKSGDLYLFKKKPVKYQSKTYPNIGNWTLEDDEVDFIKLPKKCYPEIKWEDREPTRVTVNFLSIELPIKPKKNKKST